MRQEESPLWACWLKEAQIGREYVDDLGPVGSLSFGGLRLLITAGQDTDPAFCECRTHAGWQKKDPSRPSSSYQGSGPRWEVREGFLEVMQLLGI